MSPDEYPAGAPVGADDLDLDEFEELEVASGGRRYVIYAPNGNINTGSVHGGQRIENGAAGTAAGGEWVEAQDGPISAPEILDAQTGFAEPDCFPGALEQLRTRLLFLTGEPGTGRRTTALNLLFKASGNSMALRALDSDSDLSSWRPTQSGARGYLVHGLSTTVRLGPTAIAKLRDRLDAADACMAVLLPHDPDALRRLARELDITPVRYAAPSSRAVFDTRLAALVPNARRRRELLGRLEADLDELLKPELVPAQVAELVAEVSRTGCEGLDPADLGDRLSFLAEKEVPGLLEELREDPDALAFLLVTSVLEGFDHRIVRDETDRLLELADGRLDAVLRPGADGDGVGPRPNPRFVLRRSLDELLATIRAERLPSEVREASEFTYTVEPVRFRRHRQAETVLRHVWRQYGDVSKLLTEWMQNVPGSERELAEPMGRVVGLAAGWGGGRRALRQIHELAKSDHTLSRRTAAYALSVAAQDPLLAGEVKYRLSSWSISGGWRLRSTVVDACGRDFGASRPELATSLIETCYKGRDGDERHVAQAVKEALRGLFLAGSQPAVFRQVVEWADGPGDNSDFALDTFCMLFIWDRSWFGQQLNAGTEFADSVITMIRRGLDDKRYFGRTCRGIIGWSRLAVADESLRSALEILLIMLVQEMRPGELRLLLEIEESRYPDLAGRDIAHRALEAWRRGEPQPYRSAPAFGGPR
ncbi:hypothetical protein ACFVUY_22035 [Kitasatospora sp. NPDC058063]|uniref:hypothetical protein n=1 Tax=unclassified Kitasatospora TaxID=2633591 RepID=UPI0036DAF99F